MQQYIFKISGDIAPKARPRSAGKVSYLPQKYREWKETIKCEFDLQMYPYSDDGVAFPLSDVAVEIHLTGKHRRSQDADNVAGALLDAMVQSGVIKNDSLMCLSKLSIDLDWSQAYPMALIIISAKANAPI